MKIYQCDFQVVYCFVNLILNVFKVMPNSGQKLPDDIIKLMTVLKPREEEISKKNINKDK